MRRKIMGFCLSLTFLLSSCSAEFFDALGGIVVKAFEEGTKSSDDSDSSSEPTQKSDDSTASNDKDFPSSDSQNNSQSSQSNTSSAQNLRQLVDGQPVQQQSMAGASVLVVDLMDKNTIIDVNFAQNSNTPGNGSADFFSFMNNAPAAAINGSYFNTQTFEVFGNSIKQGRVSQYRRWDDRGTALGITADNRAEMTTMRRDGWPNYSKYWFSVAAGPRLVRNGQMNLNPTAEGFQQPNVFSPNSRSAIGFSSDQRTLYLASFQSAIPLEQAASAMLSMGATEAMNLDGGGSVAQAYRGQPTVTPGRGLTNVIVVYDALNPAPNSIVSARENFINNGLQGQGQISSEPPINFDPGKFQ